MPRRPRHPACFVVAALLLLGGAPRADADDERDLEPIPRLVVFSDPGDGERDLATQRAIADEIQRSFASLGTVVRARDLLVRRFGVVSIPALMAALQRNNRTEGWNTALTVGALRDTEGPALELRTPLRPLVRVLSTSANPQSRAFAAIALGCFHWTDAELPELYAKRAGWYSAVPGPQTTLVRGREALADARQQLLNLRNESNTFMRVAGLLALAKTGGPAVRKAHLADALHPFTNPNQHRADLLTRAFLVAGDPKPYTDALRHEQTSIRAAAALAVAVALLQEGRAKWTTDSAAVLKPLKSAAHIKLHMPDGAEAVFARGVCALQNQANDEWRAIWKLATLHTVERDVARAAAQILRFCDMPWLRQEVVTWAAGSTVTLKEPVLAMVLLRAGEQGKPEAIDALLEWLRSRSKRPVPTARWDPRWYAAVGLLRALNAGRIRPKPDRARVIEGLRKSAAQIMDRKAPFREALNRLLDEHGERLAAADEKALFRLPLGALRRIEGAFTCPHGLMTRDAVDACVARVNAMVQDIFGLNGIIPWKPGEPQTKQMPERFLKRYLDRYPYFSRLEFRARRGARPHPRLDPAHEGIDR